MNLLAILTNHHHYWGIPHERQSDQRLIQTCYECGNEREIKVNLRPLKGPNEAESEQREPHAA
jgi:hypothetical protein